MSDPSAARGVPLPAVALAVLVAFGLGAGAALALLGTQPGGEPVAEPDAAEGKHRMYAEAAKAWALPEIQATQARKDCMAVPKFKRKGGTQGMKNWQDERFLSFAQEGGWVCVPEGWEAVGAEITEPGRAQFPKVQTAVLVRTEAWNREVHDYANTRFPVTLMWPKETTGKQLKGFQDLTRAAFEDVGALFPTLPDALAQPHTMLVTAGVAGKTVASDERIYPEPGTGMSIFVRYADQCRGEELVDHAVSHLYTRHRTHYLPGQAEALPFPQQDWEELQATWTETRFANRDNCRKRRLSYVYNVHNAVRTGNFSLITGPPFDNEKRFRRIEPNVVVPKSAESISIQYGHYILAPVSMVGIEGLLDTRGLSDTVEALITRTNQGEFPSFVAALESVLAAEDMAQVQSWWDGEATVPAPFIDRGRARYDGHGG